MSLDRRKYLTLCGFIFICLISVVTSQGAGTNDEDNLPTATLVSEWAQNMSITITQELDTSTASEFLKQEYIKQKYPTEKVNGSALLEDVADKWESMLQLKMTAVTKIVNKLEDLARKHTYNASLEIGDVMFVNSKNFTKDNITVQYNALFRSEVNVLNSSVQIPTDIYEGDPEVLNSIQASIEVDDVFIENAEADPELIWQYFGSAKGFYRSYPAKQWVSSMEFDQYDVRRRGWYIQATSSPKDVMILIDTSGSTYGMTLEVIKVSVSKALDTLGNDDYVMVANFSSNYSVVGCFDNFVQANLRNKELLKNKIQDLKALGQVSFATALDFAFERFRKFEEIEKEDGLRNNQGADCIRAIMIFTDGGREVPRQIYEEHNRRNGTPWVRIFVYNVGTDSMVPSDGVKTMACENKGFFSNIRSFGAVRLTTLDYVPVLSRPMVLSDVKNFQWSDIYLDALGLGMMTTLTKPVYNQTRNGTKSEQLLGVVGTDITTKNMADTVPQRKIGPEGYAFGINTNGYILLHPRLKAELGFLSDPPNVDFLEVEFEDERKVQLRKNMIDGLNGSDTFKTFVMSKDERYLEEVEMTYSYTNIENTTFSVALAQPSFDLVQYAPNLNKTEADRALSNLSPEHQNDHLVLIAPWLFCKSLEEKSPTSSDIFDSIKSNTSNSDCDRDAINKLLGDSTVTIEWVTELVKDRKHSSDLLGVKSVFVATQGGLSRIIPKDSLSAEEEFERQDPWEQSYYQRPLYKRDTFIFSVPYYDGSGQNTDVQQNITVSKAASIDENLTPAVVGVVLNATSFDKFWLSRTTKANNDMEQEFCKNSVNDLHCYLLDDGGFIIAASADDVKSDVGRFFGEVDGRVMDSLVKYQVYNKNATFDYQAACPYMTERESAGPRTVFVPSIADIMKFNLWMASAAWTFLTHMLSDLLIFGLTEPIVVDALTDNYNVSCVKLQTQFSFGPKANKTKGTGSCTKAKDECHRDWFAARIMNTNLILLSVNARCTQCDKVIIKQVPQEPKQEDNNTCEATKNPRYRKRAPSEHCYDFHPEESKICTNDSNTFLPSYLSLFLLLSLLVRQFLSLS